MIEIHELAVDAGAAAAVPQTTDAAMGTATGTAPLTATLTYDQRRRTRLRARADGGETLAIILPRGTVLRDGDVLRSTQGLHVVVRAAAERLSVVRTRDPVALARVCYHLGNRHVALQIGEGWARYQHDHVLDDMVRGLGLEVAIESLPFQPEAGAYGGHGHGHGHDGHVHEESP